MQALKQRAAHAEVYNALYDEALPIAKTGDEMELDMYFETIEKNFNNAENAYNAARDAKKSSKEIDRLSAIFEDQLLTY